MSQPTIEVSIDQHTKLMQFAFDQICDKTDWKNPIDCMVPFGTASTYMEAIEFMTGTPVHSERVVKDGRIFFRLKSVGYYAGPCN